jgi:hypothetical protein
MRCALMQACSDLPGQQGGLGLQLQGVAVSGSASGGPDCVSVLDLVPGSPCALEPYEFP